MGIFTKTYEVMPFYQGFLFRNNTFEKQLNAGFHEIYDWKDRTKLYQIPQNSQLITVTNQEILTKDNIALRFSFNIIYKVTDGLKLLENTIFNHLQIAGFNVKIGGLNNQEIDFVAEKNGERIYVQATLTINEEKTLAREFGTLLKIGDNYPKYVITLDEFDGNTFEGVQCLSLRRFIGEILKTPLGHL